MTTPLFIKICGLRTEGDVDTAVGAGADAIGFVFADSPRTVDAETARRLALRVPENVLTVGVFRGQPVEEVRALALASGVRAVQLHGDEGREHYDALRPQGWTLIRATSSQGRTPRCGELGEDLLLLDAPAPGAGVPWNWGAEGFTPPAGRWLLAGGLTPRNVGEAVRTTAPWGVDVSSGVESRRGVKDPALIRSFVEAVRAAESF
ncbi:phosphoribosylanthranilate isomerase [Streptomyces griseocarneus]|uniref:phosphoribosylanthranilate isomerase n=1 Tax=Streptomyces griseocarneus TaxID=51201 RepID=UPI00167D5E67|nr:phosphoribosylanthranilate isomerase [Streptomyces griseocarneus]MBZ6475708.1 phosphoribosylanthranilate isomerase [Streptomyces griseocarneus]GHG51211.1 N-(5'-phosphoribosyl)anthranilate isomerase [Streptomyces griseocarneus]